MATIPNILVTVDNKFIELEALITKRVGYVAENQLCSYSGETIKYDESCFAEIEKQMRALITETTTKEQG